jgi:hypothetical protein
VLFKKKKKLSKLLSAGRLVSKGLAPEPRNRLIRRGVIAGNKLKIKKNGTQALRSIEQLLDTSTFKLFLPRPSIAFPGWARGAGSAPARPASKTSKINAIGVDPCVTPRRVESRSKVQFSIELQVAEMQAFEWFLAWWMRLVCTRT